MRQSFIEPRKKKVIGSELKWLLVSMGVLFVLMVLASVLLNSAIGNKEARINTILLKEKVLKEVQTEHLEEIERFKILKKLREDISTNNRLKKENVKNFFDLVPDEVVLKSAKLRGSTLRLTGITLSKSIYNKTFQRSLNSLFTHSTTYFKKIEGGYAFRNISVMGEK